MTLDRSIDLGGADVDAVREALEAAVTEANEAISAVRAGKRVRVGHKPGEGPVTEADYAADDILHERLMPLVPGARWISEESAEEAPLLRGEPTWVVDPLDGTSEFLRGLPEFGVSVALFVRGRLVMGAVGLPAENSVLSAVIGGGRRETRRDGVTLPMLPNDGVVRRVVVSRHDYERRRLQFQIPYEVYPCGSSAVKLVHAAGIDTDVYLSTGPRSLWDIAGGVAIIEGVGGTLLQINGRPLVLSPQQIEVPAFVAGAPEDALTLLRRLGAPIDP
ncbi:MAG: 3'(2'),5'-bisphosphate nucleotidase CysQ [Chloroflexi bacterium]|nr:MAG: 3'(2'),5'-bisphosphate nucleotidase CysQ [Chloroflexota bacterium]